MSNLVITVFDPRSYSEANRQTWRFVSEPFNFRQNKLCNKIAYANLHFYDNF